MDLDAVPSETGDDEQEVTLDLYGEDTRGTPQIRTEGYYLEEALAEYDMGKDEPPRSRSGANDDTNAHTNGVAKIYGNGVGPQQRGVPQSVMLQDVDVDLQGLESTEI